MAYVDYEYYKTTFKGELDEETVTKLLDEASDQIDRLTYGRIRWIGFENLTEYQQEMIKKAVCYQVEFIYNYGEYLNIPIDSYSAGGISLSINKEDIGPGGVVADRKALDYLYQTDLTSRRL